MNLDIEPLVCKETQSNSGHGERCFSDKQSAKAFQESGCGHDVAGRKDAGMKCNKFDIFNDFSYSSIKDVIGRVETLSSKIEQLSCSIKSHLFDLQLDTMQTVQKPASLNDYITPEANKKQTPLEVDSILVKEIKVDSCTPSTTERHRVELVAGPNTESIARCQRRLQFWGHSNNAHLKTKEKRSAFHGGEHKPVALMKTITETSRNPQQTNGTSAVLQEWAEKTLRESAGDTESFKKVVSNSSVNSEQNSEESSSQLMGNGSSFPRDNGIQKHHALSLDKSKLHSQSFCNVFDQGQMSRTELLKSDEHQQCSSDFNKELCEIFTNNSECSDCGLAIKPAWHKLGTFHNLVEEINLEDARTSVDQNLKSAGSGKRNGNDYASRDVLKPVTKPGSVDGCSSCMQEGGFPVNQQSSITPKTESCVKFIYKSSMFKESKKHNATTLQGNLHEKLEKDESAHVSKMHDHNGKFQRAPEPGSPKHVDMVRTGVSSSSCKLHTKRAAEHAHRCLDQKSDTDKQKPNNPQQNKISSDERAIPPDLGKRISGFAKKIKKHMGNQKVCIKINKAEDDPNCSCMECTFYTYADSENLSKELATMMCSELNPDLIMVYNVKKMSSQDSDVDPDKQQHKPKQRLSGITSCRKPTKSVVEEDVLGSAQRRLNMPKLGKAVSTVETSLINACRVYSEPLVFKKSFPSTFRGDYVQKEQGLSRKGESSVQMQAKRPFVV